MQDELKNHGKTGVGQVAFGVKTDVEAYCYAFNGKEQDKEFGSVSGTIYDYGFRVYDPKVAKFLSVDPLTKSYPWYTPYQFAGNKPIYAIDLDGGEELPYIDRAEYNSTDGALSSSWKFTGNALKSLYNDAAGTWNYGVEVTRTGVHEGPVAAAQKVGSDAKTIGTGVYNYATTTTFDQFTGDVGTVFTDVQTYEQGLGALATLGAGAALKATKVGQLSRLSGLGVTRFTSRTISGVKVRKGGLNVVKNHLSRFNSQAPGGTWRHNEIMVQRLEGVIDGTLKATDTNLYFYTHELRENELMSSFMRDGLDESAAYQKAHTQAAKEYNVNPSGESLYTPEANKAFENQLRSEGN